MRADHSASLHVSQASVLSVDDAVKEEMHKNRSVLHIDIDSCPLKWWKEHETQFPHLSKLHVKCWLSQPLLHPVSKFFQTSSNLL